MHWCTRGEIWCTGILVVGYDALVLIYMVHWCTGGEIYGAVCCMEQSGALVLGYGVLVLRYGALVYLCLIYMEHCVVWSSLVH